MKILINRKLTVSQLNKFFLALAIIAIPMKPIFTTHGFYGCTGAIVVMALLNIVARKGEVYFSSFDWIYLTFIALNALSLLWSASGAAYITAEMFVYFCYVFSIGTLLFSTLSAKEAVNFYTRWYVIGTLIVSIVCLAHEWPDYLGAARLGKVLFAEPYGTFMMYSYSLQISAIIAIYNLIVGNNRKVYVLVSVFLVICILFNGSRKVLVGLLVFYLIASYLYNKDRTLKLLKDGFFILIIAAALLYLVMNNATLYNSYGYRLIAFLEFRNTGVGDTSALERSLLISRAFSYFTERPILGWGAHSFAYLNEINFGKNIYAHNNFVELLCDLGIAGFVLYYSIYVTEIWGLIKAERKKNDVDKRYIKLFLAGLITVLILDYWTISYYRIQFLLFFEIGAMYIHYQKMDINQHCS